MASALGHWRRVRSDTRERRDLPDELRVAARGIQQECVALLLERIERTRPPVPRVQSRNRQSALAAFHRTEAGHLITLSACPWAPIHLDTETGD